MNRVDRLLAIVLELQAARGYLRAETLAARFEIGRRTVYRDMQALAEMGIPIISTPGQGYTVDEAYFLPPLQFTADEATLLLLGADFISQHLDEQYRVVAHSAAKKIQTVMSDPLREESDYLRAGLSFVVPERRTVPMATLQTVRRAVIQRRTIRFTYTARSDDGSEEGRTSHREADPYRLVSHDFVWYVRAYCHMRKDVRNFRLDRMANVQLTAKTFTRAPSLPIGEQPDLDPRDMTVCVLFSPSVARWVREDRNFYTVDEQDTPDGLLVTFRVRQERDLLRWLLGWGASVRVIEPQSLHDLLLAETKNVLSNLENC